MPFLSTIFQYTALMMVGISVGGILSGEFPIGGTLISLAFIVFVIGGLAKVFSLLFGAPVIRFLDTKQKKRIAGLIAFGAGLIAVFFS